MTIQAKDFGSYLSAAPGFVDGSATAGGTGDATEKAGEILDKLAMDHPLSALLCIPYSATLAEDETLSLKAKVEHGADSGLSDVADYTFGGAEVDFGVVATGGTGGSTETGVAVMRVDLSGVKQYFRCAVTPDLSASSTDTATFGAMFVLGGLQNMPTNS